MRPSANLVPASAYSEVLIDLNPLDHTDSAINHFGAGFHLIEK